MILEFFSTYAIQIITGSAATYVLYKALRKKRSATLTKGETKSILGLTIQLKDRADFILEIIPQDGTVGDHKVYNAKLDAISYQFIFERVNRVLTANVNTSNSTLRISIS